MANSIWNGCFNCFRDKVRIKKSSQLLQVGLTTVIKMNCLKFFVWRNLMGSKLNITTSNTLTNYLRLVHLLEKAKNLQKNKSQKENKRSFNFTSY
jgi:hypothetical protein